MSQEKSVGIDEEGIAVPYKQIEPDTLRNMIEEFVTRDGADWGDPGCRLEDKITLILLQLKNNKVQIVFDLKSNTANIVVNKGPRP